MSSVPRFAEIVSIARPLRVQTLLTISDSDRWVLVADPQGKSFVTAVTDPADREVAVAVDILTRRTNEFERNE